MATKKYKIGDKVKLKKIYALKSTIFEVVEPFEGVKNSKEDLADNIEKLREC